jgi:uncharacterized protein DUF2188
MSKDLKGLKDLLDAEGATSEEAEVMSDQFGELPDHVRVTRGHGRSRTLQVRLNGDEFHALELLAKGRDLPVSTLARSLILTALAPSSDAGATLTRIEQELLSLRQALGNGEGVISMTKGDVETYYEGGSWKNRPQGNQRASSTHDTKAEAQAAGRQMAKDRQVEHVIKNKDGQIGQRNSYGNDPERSKG